MANNSFKVFITILAVVSAACSSQPDVQSIIDKAIAKHGGQSYNNTHITFTFRDTRYSAEMQNGRYVYTRQMDDSAGVIVDRLTNEDFKRSIDGEATELSAENDSAYASSLNSVIYFALLPYKLNDAAVNKRLLDETTVKGEPYYEIEVTFDQEGGGTDYQDRYIYWIHREDFTMDYLAYRFHVDGGGTRFREAKNERTINGIRFADYHNFGSTEMQQPLEDYETYFEADTLSKVSEINLENIEVMPVDEKRSNPAN